MPTDLTFESACKIVKGEHPELTEDVDAFLNIALTAGVAILAIPITVASGAAALTPALIALTSIGTLSNLFGVKNEIFKVGTRVVSNMTSEREQDVHEQYVRMQQAYTLICYTAFFETLAGDKQLAPLLKKIKMKREEKIRTAIAASKDLWSRLAVVADDSETTQDKLTLFKYEIVMPQPGDTFETQRKQLAPLYEQLARHITVFFELETIKPSTQSEQEQIKQALAEIPKKALDTFVEQYYALAMKFPEFAIWLNIQKDDKIIDFIDNKMIQLIADKMKQLLDHMAQVEQQQTDRVLRSLVNYYKSVVDAPIIDDPDSGLTYPLKRDAFIPQAFKVVHYENQEQLKESSWDGLPERHDLQAFLSAYFSHEEASTRTPLITLGQPGSGKSLLTSMIAAQLIPLPFTPIRVELRNTNAEDYVSAQIEGQIRRDTERNFDWATLHEHTVNSPALVLFDGYDELLQATGNVFSGYLNKITNFQKHQLQLSEGQQSVRTIVTSRFTLIDKAEIPRGTTIIRLLEFNEEQQKRWIDEWNKINASYFEQNHTEAFKLPQDHENIKELARQPLLLTMLAIYDAKENPLSKAASDLDRSLLYDKLLRRFIEREQQKDVEDAQVWRKSELEKATDHEMRRLGVAAIGMFNRRTISIRAGELDADLQFFNLEKSWLETNRYKSRTAAEQINYPLLPSEKLFGSFFFQKLEAVRKTKETRKDQIVLARPDDVTYEFLHNTFGEFLMADFMLHKILEETRKIRRNQVDGDPEIDLTSFHKTWYARFIYAPLFSRPIVLTLLREWLQHCLQKEGRTIQKFLEDFDTIIVKHIDGLLTNNNLPGLMTSDQRPFASLDTTGYIAIYTLNLLLLRTFLDPSDAGYTFDETNYTSSEDSVRTWDRLTYLWRSWFSLETLQELATIFKAERDDSKLYLSIQTNLNSHLSRDPLNLVYGVSQTLADNVTAGLSGLLLHDVFTDDKNELNTIIKRLETEQITENVWAYLLTKQFRRLQRSDFQKEDVLRFFEEANELIEQEREGLILENKEFALSLYTEMLNLLRYSNQYVSLKPVLFEVYENIRGLSCLEVIMSTELATELVKLAYERNDQSRLSDLLSYFMRSLRSKLVYDNEVDVDLTLKVVRFAYETGNQELLVDFLIKYLDTLFEVDRRVPITLTVELLKLLFEIKDQQVIKLLTLNISEVIQRSEYIQPDLAFGILKFISKNEEQKVFVAFKGRYLTDALQNQKLVSVELAVEIVKLALESEEYDWVSIEGFYRKNITLGRCYLGLLPIDTIVDLRELARKFGDEEVLGKINERLKL